MQVCFVEKLNETTARVCYYISLYLTFPGRAELQRVISEEDVPVS